MRLDPDVVEAACDRARVHGRARQVLQLLAEELPADEVARRLEISTATVHVYVHRARKKFAEIRHVDERRDLCRFLLDEAMLGPRASSPPHALYRTAGPDRGERVRLRGGRLVDVDDLLAAKNE